MILLKNANIVNNNQIFSGSILIDGKLIKAIYEGETPEIDADIIDIDGKYIIPGIIDDQVHFRDPGLTYKADIASESRAAIAGGVTSYMDMPNNNPPILTQELLEKKYEDGARKSMANFSFYMGSSNDNLDEILKTNPKNVCGIKVFMGSSTGNMLVDNPETLKGIFSQAPTLVATHCEDEATIKKNTAEFKEKYGLDMPIRMHPLIRSAEACYLSSSMAVKLAKENNTRLHVLHLTTAKEMGLFDNKTPLKEKKITAEVCVHHLIFNDKDYDTYGTKIKWNPAVKTETDRKALLQALIDNKIDVIATDHAPHTADEKDNNYFDAPSGGPLVQHSLVSMLEFYHRGELSLEQIVTKMCHAPADCFSLEKRGFIKEGYFADLVVVDLDNKWTADKSNVLYKVGWSPFDGKEFKSKVLKTFVNGSLVYNDGEFMEDFRGDRLLFDK
ncbi:MAG: dihydroorotase [Bacteroidetes bacterium]|nr:MAG: dihydroorotase [Bacteroidota bacterium]